MPNNNGGGPLKAGSPKSVIKFGEKVDGFRMMYLGDVFSDFTIAYSMVAGGSNNNGDFIYLFNDEAVNIIVNTLTVYTPGADIYSLGVQFKDLAQNINGDQVKTAPYDESTAEYSIANNLRVTYMMLDPDWSNDIEPSSTPRVQIAQGQSDITRHESYFKKELSPNYEGAVDIQEELENLMEYLHVSNVEDITFIATSGYVNGTYINVLSHQGATDPRTGNATKIVFNSIPDPDPDQQSGVVRGGYGCYSFELNLTEGIYPFDYSLTSRIDDEFANIELAIDYFYISPQLLKFLDGKAKMEVGSK